MVEARITDDNGDNIIISITFKHRGRYVLSARERGESYNFRRARARRNQTPEYHAIRHGLGEGCTRRSHHKTEGMALKKPKSSLREQFN